MLFLQAVKHLMGACTSGSMLLLLLEMISKAVQTAVAQKSQARAQALHTVVSELPHLTVVLDKTCVASATEQDLQWQVQLLFCICTRRRPSTSL